MKERWSGRVKVLGGWPCRRAGQALLAALRVERKTEGYEIDLVRLGRVAGVLLGVLFVGVHLVILVVTMFDFPLLSPRTNVEEQLNYYQAARNFNAYGFANSGFLQDLATSSSAAHHPFVYAHQPPGPEIAVALLTRLVGERYALIRLAFALLFCAGVVQFVRFANLVLGRVTVPASGMVLMFLAPFVMYSADHPALSLFPLFAFSPPLALEGYYATGQRRRLLEALAMVFGASLYLMYQQLLLVLLVWALLAWTGLVRATRLHLLAVGAAALAGVALHAVQGLLYFGPAVFARELFIALSNRVSGTPSYEAVAGFYRSIDAVQHGRHHLQAARVLAALAGALDYPGRAASGIAALAAIGVVLARHSRLDPGNARLTLQARALSELAGSRRVQGVLLLGGSIVAGTAVALLLLPAYASDYGLQGASQFYLAILGAGAFSLLACEVGRAWRPGSDSPGWSAARAVLVVVALTLLIKLAAWQVQAMREFAETAAGGNRFASLVELERYVGGRVAMTNVNSTTVGFFSREAVFGGCEDRAVAPDGRPSLAGCYTAYLRGYGRSVAPEPARYVLVRAAELFPGFSQCREECLARLYERTALRHPVLFENRAFAVFDLSASPPAGRGREGKWDRS